MRKGTKIQNVEISASREVNAFDSDGCRVKLTRTQRTLFSNYKNPDFFEDVWKEFGSDILAPDFYIVKSGQTVFTRN